MTNHGIAPLPPLGPIPLPVNPTAKAVAQAVERIQRHLLVVQALEYIKCRRAGGSMEECLFGKLRITPPRPDDPHLEELLGWMDPKEADQLLAACEEHLSAQREVVTKLRADLGLKGRPGRTKRP